MVIQEKIVPIYNEEIIEEYEEVLLRNKFAFNKKLVKNTLYLIENFGLKMSKIEIKEKFNDPNDKKFYQIVMSARRTLESYLVTGNLKDFPSKSFIVNPTQMLEIIKTNSKNLRFL